MRSNSLSVYKRRLVLAFVLALALMLISGGIASAAPRGTAPSDVVKCLDASPITQTINVWDTAYVKVEVACYPSQPVQYVTAVWGDGTTTQYPICLEVCHFPPITILTSHTYSTIGDYFPIFCLGPAASSSLPNCVRVEIRVVLEVTPLARSGIS